MQPYITSRRNYEALCKELGYRPTNALGSPIIIVEEGPTEKAMEEVRTVDKDTGAEKGVKLERYDLIPAGPLADLAKLYGIGAVKYRKVIANCGCDARRKLAELCSCTLKNDQPNATQTDDTPLKDCVSPATSHSTPKLNGLLATQTESPFAATGCAPSVTTDASKPEIQPLLNGSDLTTLSGNRATRSTWQSTKEITMPGQTINSRMLETLDSLYCQLSDLLGKTKLPCSPCKEINVQSAAALQKAKKPTLTSTTNMAPLCRAGCCVGDATKGSGCWATALKDYKRHSDTCAVRRCLSFTERGLESSGDHNYRKGYAWSKSFAALMRHAWAFWRGEDLDSHKPDCPKGCTEHTEMPHIIAVVFHAFALAEFRHTHPEKDDRWVEPKKSAVKDSALLEGRDYVVKKVGEGAASTKPAFLAVPLPAVRHPMCNCKTYMGDSPVCLVHN